MCDLGAVSTGPVRGVVGSGGIGACTLGYSARGRSYLGSGLGGVGAGFIAGMFCTLSSVAQGGVWAVFGDEIWLFSGFVKF